MPEKLQRNIGVILYTLFLSILITSGCSNLDIKQNNSDYFGEAMKSKGNELEIDSTPITERIANIIRGDSSVGPGESITFEVALEQFSIMPLLSVDRAGGVIITDWYSISNNSNERVKFNIVVKDELMTNESIEIYMFKETYNGTSWVQISSNPNTSNKIKELILKKSNRLKATAKLS